MKEKLLGSWTLEDYAFEFDDGSRQTPYGDNPIGRLHYSGNDQVFVHMMAANRAPLDCDTTTASGEAARTALGTHISYCGTYWVKDNAVCHHVTISMLPDFVGQVLRRDVKLDGSRLTLSAPNASFGGKRGVAILKWRRL